ncbi:MAG: ABC transporter ATP-binding protein [Planctomycetes bacterium]|nr:ABC transporter ATP-binding protein [Planctomycetota bacterium]
MPSKRPLLEILHRYRWRYALGAVCVVATTALRLTIPRFLWSGLDALSVAQHAQGTLSAAELSRLEGVVARAALWIVLAALLQAPVRTASRLAVLGASRRVAHDLLQRVFDVLLRLSPSFFLRNPTGQLMSRCINDRNFVRGLSGPVFMYMAETITLYAIAVPLLLSIDARLGGLALLPYPVFLVLARVIARGIQEEARLAQEALSDVSEKVDESLSGELVIKTLAIEDSDYARFDERCRAYRRHNLRVAWLRALLTGSMMALAGLSTTLVVWIGGPRVVRGEMSIEDFGLLLTYLAWLAGPTRTLGFVISSMRRGLAAYGRIAEILEAEPELADPPRVGPAPTVGAGALSLRGLTLTYPPLSEQPHLSGSLPEHLVGSAQDRPRTVLRDVTLEVPAGTTLGVVGHTGAGKTTLARVLARQLAIEPGQVFLDDVDLCDYDLAEVRRHTGFVPQEAFLFSATLAENVALGRPDAPREEVAAAVRAAQLQQDLDQLPQGLDTLLGERGVNLSGGQRQRTALARVLLLDPRLLILDDTLSAVDPPTADAILAHLRPFAARRTTLLVAHRLSTVRHAEQIVVLEDGAVVERGTHAQLLALGGRYADTWRSQEDGAAQARRARELEPRGEPS